MSTSFLYHAFGLPGYDYIPQEFEGGAPLCMCDPRASWSDVHAAEAVMSSNVLHRGVSERWLRAVPVGFKPAWLVVKVPRIGCLSCGLVRLIKLRIAEPRRRHTKAFARFVLALTTAMTKLEVFRLLGVGWDVVKPKATSAKALRQAEAG